MHDETPAPPQDGRDPLPQHTTPTWEMELLISGATVFSLLQLPDLLDIAFYALFPRLDSGASAIVLLPYVYLIAATYALIGTFVLHLGARAYWVSLVGLRSVYPEGVNWEGLRWGPLYKRAVRDRFPGIAKTVEAADNRASRVFGFGIGFALMLLAPLLLMVVLATITYALYELSGHAISWGVAWGAVFVLFFGPFMAVFLLDKLAPRQMESNGVVARGAARVLHGYLRAGFGSVTNYPILLFFSRYGQYKSSMMTSIGIFAVLGVVMLRMLGREDVFNLDGYNDLPSLSDTRGRSLDPRNYADQRDGRLTLVPLPFIQSEVVVDDYLRLFIPYQPARDAPLLHGLCREALVPAASSDDLDERNRLRRAAANTLLDCVGQVYSVLIDGTDVPDLHFDLASESGLGLRGFVAMIDVRDLPRGRHELLIQRPPLPDTATPEEMESYERRKTGQGRVIAFWR